MPQQQFFEHQGRREEGRSISARFVDDGSLWRAGGAGGGKGEEGMSSLPRCHPSDLLLSFFLSHPLTKSTFKSTLLTHALSSFRVSLGSSPEISDPGRVVVVGSKVEVEMESKTRRLLDALGRRLMEEKEGRGR